MTNTTGQPKNPQSQDKPGQGQGNNRPGEQHHQDKTSQNPNDAASKPPTSAQQAKQDGRSAQPGADADDLDSQDRIPDQRR